MSLGTWLRRYAVNFSGSDGGETDSATRVHAEDIVATRRGRCPAWTMPGVDARISGAMRLRRPEYMLIFRKGTACGLELLIYGRARILSLRTNGQVGRIAKEGARMKEGSEARMIRKSPNG